MDKIKPSQLNLILRLTYNFARPPACSGDPIPDRSHLYTRMQAEFTDGSLLKVVGLDGYDRPVLRYFNPAGAPVWMVYVPKGKMLDQLNHAFAQAAFHDYKTPPGFKKVNI